MYSKIGFIGCGNMGSALARALSKSELKTEIFLSNRSIEKAEALAKELGAHVSNNAEIAKTCDLIFLCVKPQMMKSVLEAMSLDMLARSDRFVLCTIAAGLSCETIQDFAGSLFPIIRIMPNTPVSIGKGMIQLCSKDTKPQEIADFETILEHAGTLDEIDERLIDAASAVSGCGPAFAYMFAEALADGAVECGLPRDKALKYAACMLEGSASLLLNSGAHPGELKDSVCSPGGTTIEGVYALESAGFRGAVMDAVIAAYEKTLELK